MSRLYLTILPDDIIMVILSKIENESDMKVMVKISYKIYKLLCNDVTYSMLLYLRSAELYKFIKNCKNVDGHGHVHGSTWKELFYFFTPNRIVSVDPIPFASSYVHDILYLYLISKEFPKIYDYIFDINLDHTMFLLKPYKWSDVYICCHKFKSYKFVQGEFTEINYQVLDVGIATLYKDVCPREYKVKPFEHLMLMVYSLINKDISPHHLILFYYTNLDIYEKLVHYIDPKVKISLELAADLKRYCLDNHRPSDYIESFLEDLSSRITGKK